MEIELDEKEIQLFSLIRDSLISRSQRTQPRVAGGWVRDKLLGVANDDIDIALDDLSGVEFAHLVNDYLKENGQEVRTIAVIQANPDQSKHLETANLRVLGFEIDCVNLRAESYSTDSRIPEIRFGTPLEDAERRDFTINSLFFNLSTNEVEDLTGQGLKDLRLGLIRTPLDPLTTFLDDPLRVMRAVRFASRLGFSLVPSLVSAALSPEIHSALRQKVSKERLLREWEGMMDSRGHPALSLALIHNLNLLDSLLSLPPSLIPSPSPSPSLITFNSSTHSNPLISSIPPASLSPQEVLEGWERAGWGTEAWVQILLALRERGRRRTIQTMKEETARERERGKGVMSSWELVDTVDLLSSSPPFISLSCEEVLQRGTRGWEMEAEMEGQGLGPSSSSSHIRLHSGDHNGGTAKTGGGPGSEWEGGLRERALFWAGLGAGLAGLLVPESIFDEAPTEETPPSEEPQKGKGKKKPTRVPAPPRPSPLLLQMLRHCLKMDSETLKAVLSLQEGAGKICSLIGPHLEGRRRLGELHISSEERRSLLMALREEAGQVIREVGSGWTEALLLACASQLARQHPFPQPSSEREMESKTEQEPTLQRLFPSSIHISLSLLDCLVSFSDLGRFWGEELGMGQAWKMKPLIDGTVLLSRLSPLLQKGPQVGRVMEEQIRWQLRHSWGVTDKHEEGEEDSLLTHLRAYVNRMKEAGEDSVLRSLQKKQKPEEK